MDTKWVNSRGVFKNVKYLGWSFFAKMVNGKAGPMFYATPTKKKQKNKNNSIIWPLEICTQFGTINGNKF